MSRKRIKSIATSDEATFAIEPGFCPDCGSVLPQLRSEGGVICYGCRREFSADVFFRGQKTAMTETYVIRFNELGSMEADARHVGDTEVADGPVVERRCPQCGNDAMSYATLQLRSADEGQTIFYTCTKCKFKETENS